MFGKKIRKRFTFILLMYLVSPPEFNYAIDTKFIQNKIQQLENIKQKFINDKINKNKKINEQQEFQCSLGKSISGLETEITLIIGSVDKLELEIENYDIQIEQIEKEKEKKEKFVGEKKKVLGKCFRLIYTHKVPNAYELLFQTCSFEDFVDKSRVSQLVIKEFFRIADTVENEKAKIKDDLKKINNIKNHTKDKLNEIDSKKKLLEKKKKDLEKSYSNSKQSEVKIKKEIDYDDAEVRRVDREVEMYRKKLAAQAKPISQHIRSSSSKSKKQSYTVPEIVTGTLLWPVPGCNRITSGFYDSSGRRSQHNALDITASVPGAIMGEPILAPADMLITYAGWCGGYGNHVRGEFTLNGQTYEVRFGHLCSISVLRGQYVTAGTVIGHVGNTGYSFGAHLHFEIRKNSIPIDPESFSYSGRVKTKTKNKDK